MENRNYKNRNFKETTLLAAILILFSCNNNKIKQQQADETQARKGDTEITAADTSSLDKTMTGENCFAYIKNHDTILLKMNLKNGIVTGNLTYNLYEKDKNSGTLNGTLKNDTLLANYTYLSEGTSSERQVIFLVKGNVLVQGTGSMKEQNDRFVFTEKKDINFNSSITLESVDCNSFDKK